MKDMYLEDTPQYVHQFCGPDVPLPELAVFEVSSRCNLACTMCPRSLGRSPSGDSGDLPVQAFSRLENLLQQLDHAVLSWIGEPLLHPRLAEILRILKRHDLRVHITSNGMLIDDEMARMLVAMGLDGLAISIDAADEAEYRRIRRGGSLLTVKDSIRRIQRMKRRMASIRPVLQIAFVAMRENASQFPDIVRLAQDLGIGQVTFGVVDDFGLTEEYELEEGAFLGPGASEAFKDAEELAKAAGIDIGIESAHRFYRALGDGPPQYLIDEIFFLRLDPTQTEAKGFRKGCIVPWLHTFVAHNGDVHPCCIADVAMGNIFETPFEEIWRGEAYQTFREKLRSTDPPEICWHCRRTIWNNPRPLEMLTDRMEAGGYEAHGLGWGELQHDDRNRAYRLVAREATLFLRNSGKPIISLEIGGQRPSIVTGQILVNGRPLDSLRVRPGWQTISLPLGQEEAEVLAVTLKLPSSDSGVGVHRVELVEEAQKRFHQLPMRKAADCRCFVWLEDAWRVGWQALRLGVRYLWKAVPRRLK
jgi:radical SAM protein with 4Fe4S-binding SPASM domain